MSEKAALTRLNREYAIIQQSPKIPHIVARPAENNMLIWHFVLHDLPSETAYAGGVYAGKLVFPTQYPLKPPAIYMLTPSGRFEVNTRLCLSMSDFHPESWNPSWRIESILVGLVSFMLDPSEPRTTGGMHTSAAKRREFAKASFAFNVARADFRELFPEFCDTTRRCADGRFSLTGEIADTEAKEQAEEGAPAAEGGAEVAEPPEQPKPTLPKILLALSVVVLLASLLGRSFAERFR
eukprot:TRINITY_DN62414_c0_g1_i1.p1 TRINITY_DN62414_c0_g1~~TRINITY_DN62414_c0_g1_i1.p1  ORF type:complete len:247 (+),score=40.05 TRINITY_DN62414_c0_g1_i1:30-743(+)